MEHVVNWITGTNYNSLTMPCPGKLALLFCYVVTCVCWVAAFPFYATHKLPSSNVPVNCGRNQTVFMVTGLGHRLCGEDYFITKKDNMTQFGKVSLFCSPPGFFYRFEQRHSTEILAQISVVISINALQIVFHTSYIY